MGMILAVILLGAAGWALWASHVAQDTLTSYGAAPPCAAGVHDTTSCRLQAQARVTSTKDYTSSTTLHVTLTEYGGDYIASINKPAAAKTGDLVNVEVWRGNVTRLNEEATGDNPEVSPNLNLNGIVAVIGIFVAICFGVAVAGEVRPRSARRGPLAAAQAEGGLARPMPALR